VTVTWRQSWGRRCSISFQLRS